MLSERMREWAKDNWKPDTGISVDELAEIDNQSVLIFADEAAALENKYFSLRKAVGQGMADTLHDYEAQLAALRELQAELEPYALHLEPDVVLYKATPNLVPHAEALEKFLTIMRSLDA